MYVYAFPSQEKLKAMGVQLDAHSAQRTGLAMQPIGTSAVEVRASAKAA